MARRNPAPVRIDSEQLKRSAATIAGKIGERIGDKLNDEALGEFDRDKSPFVYGEELDRHEIVMPTLSGKISVPVVTQVIFNDSPRISFSGSFGYLSGLGKGEKIGGVLSLYVPIRPSLGAWSVYSRRDLRQAILSVLKHEATHVARSPWSPNRPSYALKPGDKSAYYNDPEEVEAFAQQVVDEALLLRASTPARVKLSMLAYLNSPSWTRIEPYLTERNKRKVYQKLARALYDADIRDVPGTHTVVTKPNPVTPEQRKRMSLALFALPQQRKYRLDSPARKKYSLTLLNKHYRDGARSKRDYETAYVNICLSMLRSGQSEQREPSVRTKATLAAYNVVSGKRSPGAVATLGQICNTWIRQGRAVSQNCKAVVARGNPTMDSRIKVIRLLGEEPTILSPSRVLKPAFVAKLPDQWNAVHYFQKRRAWMLLSDSRGSAEKLAASAFKNLIAKRSLTASDPFLHDKTLYVAYPDGYVVAEPPEAKPKSTTGPSDLKSRLLDKGREFFGESGFSVAGRKGDYAMTIRPALKRFKGVFGPSTTRADSLEELERRLDTVIAKLEQHLGREG
ncbi:MAG: hypothetical protein WC565_03630 [Parcubacteria group bacterium]|jgi:hypothetical protein